MFNEETQLGDEAQLGELSVGREEKVAEEREKERERERERGERSIGGSGKKRKETTGRTKGLAVAARGKSVRTRCVEGR